MATKLERRPPVSTAWPRYRVQICLLLAMLIAHSPALVSGFVWDDFHFLETWLPRFKSFNDIFLPPPNIPQWPYYYYRPLGVLSLKVDNLLFGNQLAYGYHISNLVMHGIVCLLVYQLLKQIFCAKGESVAAVAGAMIFAVHPIHVESVNWIAGRSDILAVISCLGTLLLSLRYLRCRQWRWAIGASVSLLTGLLFKELAVCAIPLFCILLGLLRFESSDLNGLLNRVRLSIPLLICQSIAVVVYVLARYYVGAPSAGNHSGSPQSVGLLGTVVQAGGYYLGQMFLLQPQVVQAPTSFLPSLTMSVMMMVSCLTVPIVLARTGRDTRPLWIGLLWFALSIAPSLAVITRQTDSAFLSERYLYLPSIGFAIAAGWAIMGLLRLSNANSIRTRFAYAVVVFIGIALMIKTAAYGVSWIDNDTMWTRVLRIVPEHWNAYVQLSESSKRQKDYGQMIDYSWKAVEAAQTEREKAMLCARVAIIGRERNLSFDRARAAELATRLDPDLPDGWLELGIVEFEAGDQALAESHFQRAIQCDAKCSEAYVNLARLSGDEARSIEYLFKAIEANPWNKMAYNNLGVIHAKRGSIRLAKACMQKAIDIDPEFQMAIDNLILIQGTL